MATPARLLVALTVTLVALTITLFLVDAYGETTAAALASGAPTSLVAAPPKPSPVQPIVLSGTNSKVTDPMDIPPGNYRVSWQGTDTGRLSDGSTMSENFVVYVQGKSKTLIVDAVLPDTPSGQSLLSSAGGGFIIDVEADQATWNITLTWLSP